MPFPSCIPEVCINFWFLSCVPLILCSSNIFQLNYFFFIELSNYGITVSLSTRTHTQGVHERMMWFQKLIKNVFLALYGQNIHC
jgi:hypothetical protein